MRKDVNDFVFLRYRADNPVIIGATYNYYVAENHQKKASGQAQYSSNPSTTNSIRLALVRLYAHLKRRRYRINRR